MPQQSPVCYYWTTAIRFGVLVGLVGVLWAHLRDKILPFSTLWASCGVLCMVFAVLVLLFLAPRSLWRQIQQAKVSVALYCVRRRRLRSQHLLLDPQHTLPQDRDRQRHIIHFQALFLGTAVGDAFGAGVEMESAEWIRAHVNFNEYKETRSMGKKSFAVNYSEGLYTDDTEMTVAVAQYLLQHRPHYDHVSGLLNFFTEEHNARGTRWLLCCCHGGNEQGSSSSVCTPRLSPSRWSWLWRWAVLPRQGHGSIRRYWNGTQTISELRQGQQRKRYPGNAPPMRAVPLGLVRDPQRRFVLCMANADTTHPHPKARISSWLVAEACSFLVVEPVCRPTHEPTEERGLARHGVHDSRAQQQQQQQEAVVRHCHALWEQRIRDAPTSSALHDSQDDIGAYLLSIDALSEPPPVRLERDLSSGTESKVDLSSRHVDSPGPWLPATVAQTLLGEQPHPHTGFFGLGADALRTLGCVLWLLKWHRRTFETLQRAILVGGDVDSLASICMGIVCARDGLHVCATTAECEACKQVGCLPQWLFEPLEGVQYLQEVGNAMERWWLRSQL